jgi:hypothetical protein
MQLELHPEAAEAITSKGRSLLTRIVEHPIAPPQAATWSQRPAAVQITEADLVAQPRMGSVDMFGRQVSAYFFRGQKRYGLSGEAYQELRRTADQALKAPALRRTVSRRFVEECVFDWCDQHFGVEAPPSLADYLVSRAAAQIRQFSIWVPIANLEVEKEFEIGPVGIRTITKQMLDDQEQIALKYSPHQAEDIKEGFADWRRKLQGRASAVCIIEAERRHAINKGLELADATIGLLRLYSVAAYTPWLISPCAILGSEFLPSTTTLAFEGDTFSVTQQLTFVNVHIWTM